MTNIQVKKIELVEIKMQLQEPFQISSGTQYDRRILLLKFEDQSGHTAWSECCAGNTPIYSPETTDTARLILENFIIPDILNVPFNHPSEVFAYINKTYKGHLMAKAAVEMGCWLIAAQIEGQSLASYIGGKHQRLKSGISIGIQDSPEKLVEKVNGYLDEGYHKIKMKIKPGYDLAYVDAVRKHCGNGFDLMVDANNAYTLDDIAVLKKLDQYDLIMIEQPLYWDDVFEHRDVQKQLKTPVCLDESIVTLKRAQEMIAHKSGRIINIKPGRLGGLRESIAVHDFCQENQIPVWCGGMLETGIGRAYNVALASLPNFTLPGDLSNSKRYWVQDVVSPEWQMDSEGYFQVPFDQPGLGVTVNEAYIDSIAIKKAAVS